MNYEIFLDSDGVNPILLKKFETLPELRPVIGTRLQIQNDLRIFNVNRTDPADNPADQKVTYFVNVVRPVEENRRYDAQTDFILR
ncbi:MAG: hypothetical protein ACR2LL_08745, partial [Nitrosopumilus sp.]